jgi:hypothetical protein
LPFERCHHAAVQELLGGVDRAAGTATVQLVAPGALYGDRLNQVDFRVTKAIKVNRTSVRAMVGPLQSVQREPRPQLEQPVRANLAATVHHSARALCKIRRTGGFMTDRDHGPTTIAHPAVKMKILNG